MPIVTTGSLTIIDVNDGFTPYLTNDSTVLAADNAGTVVSYAGAETQFQIMDSGVNATNDWTFYVSGTGGGVSYRGSADTVDRTGVGQVDGTLGGDNAISNSACVGLATGSPGTPPTGWLISAGSGINSLIVGSGTQGGVPYVDVRFQGVASAQTTCSVRFENNATIAAAIDQVWTGSIFTTVISGSLGSPSSGPRLVLQEQASNGNALSQSVQDIQIFTGAQLATQRFSISRAFSSVGVAFANLLFSVQYNAGATVDVTLRIGGPMLNLGDRPGEFAATSPTIKAGTRGYLRVTSLTQDLSYIDITAIKLGGLSVSRRYSIAKVRAGATGATGASGANGTNGTRGTITTARAISGTAWSDSEALAAIVAAGGVAPIPGDVVTLFNSGSSFSQTRVRSGSSTWTALAAFFGGDVLVDGTLAASKLLAGTISADKLAIGVSGNHCWNSCFAYSQDGWSVSGGVGGYVTIAATDDPDWSLSGLGSGVLRPNADMAHNGYTELLWRPNGTNPAGVPVRVGEKIAVQAEVIPRNGIWARVVVWWLDANNSITGLAVYGSAVTSTLPAHGRALASYSRLTAITPAAPSGTARALVAIRMSNESGATIPLSANPFLVVTRVGINSVPATASAIPDWSPGGITDISGGLLRNNAIITRHLATDSVTTDKITAGAVTAAEIAANAVTAEKLVLGDFLNRVEAPTFIDGANSWGAWSNGAGGVFGALPTGVSIGSNAANAYIGTNYLSLTTGATSTGVVSNVNVFPVVPGDIYVLRATARSAASPNADLVVRLRFYQADRSTVVAASGTSDLTFGRTTDTVYTTRILSSANVVVPAGAVFAAIQVVPAATLTAGEWRVGEVFVSRRATGELIVDGGISTEKLAANAVTASKVMIGEISNAYPDFDCMDPGYYSGDAFSLVGSGNSGTGRNRIQIGADASTRVVRSTWFTVENSTDYAIYGTAFCITGSTSTTARLQIEFGSIDATGVITSTRLLDVVPANSLASVARQVAFALTTSTERRARFVMTKSANSGSAVAFSGFTVRRRANGELIVDGEVTANKVRAGAIITDKLGVGSPNNVIWNACPGNVIDGWTAPGASGSATGVALTPSKGSFFDPTWVLPGFPGMVINAATLGPGVYIETTWSPDGSLSGSIPVAPGDNIEIQALLAIPSNLQAVVYTRFTNSAGSEIGVGSYITHNGTGPANGQLKSNYTRVGGKSVAPANSVAAKLVLRLVNPTGATVTNPMGVFTQLGIGFGNPNQVELAPWQPGGVTNISGGVLRTDSVTARVLQAGSVTASKLLIQAGSILPDGDFDDTNFWFIDSGLVTLNASGANTASTLGVRRALMLDGANYTGTGQRAAATLSFGSVSAGQIFRLRARGLNNNTTRPIQVQIYAVNSAGGVIGSPAQISWLNESASTKDIQYTVPTGGVRLVVWVVIPTSGATAWSGTAAVGAISVAPAADGSLIVQGSVTADKLDTVNAVITGTAQIGNGVISSANIGDLQVTNANIANLTVGTSKIGYGQVTRMAETGSYTAVVRPGGAAPITGQSACYHTITVHVDRYGVAMIFVKASLKTSATTDPGAFGGGEGGSDGNGDNGGGDLGGGGGMEG